MANDRNYRIGSQSLDADRMALTALQRLSDYKPFNTNYQVAALVALNNALEQAKQTLDMVPEAKRNEAPVAAARAALDVAEQAKSLGPLAELEDKVRANPLDHQARFDLAVALNSKGRRQEAVDNLLAIVKRDRKWNDDGARKQLVQFFEAWGPTDEATVTGRKRLSSVLFS